MIVHVGRKDPDQVIIQLQDKKLTKILELHTLLKSRECECSALPVCLIRPFLPQDSTILICIRYSSKNDGILKMLIDIKDLNIILQSIYRMNLVTIYLMSFIIVEKFCVYVGKPRLAPC